VVAALIAVALLRVAPAARADGPSRTTGDAGPHAAAGVVAPDERPPRAIPFKRDEPQGSSAVAIGAVATLACIALLAAGALALGRRAGWFRRRPGGARGWGAWLAPKSGDRPLTQLQMLRLTPRASLHLIRWGERELLVGCSEAGVTLLERSASAPGAGTSPTRPAGTAGGDR
jgi:hypothetical protein